MYSLLNRFDDFTKKKIAIKRKQKRTFNYMAKKKMDHVKIVEKTLQNRAERFLCSLT